MSAGGAFPSFSPPRNYRGLEASVAGEEVEGGRGQLLVVARSDEPPLLHVVVEDSRPGKVLLGLEGVEHEDPRVAREAAVVEESKGEVAHRQAVPAPGRRSPATVSDDQSSEPVWTLSRRISSTPACARGRSRHETGARRPFQGMYYSSLASRALRLPRPQPHERGSPAAGCRGRVAEPLDLRRHPPQDPLHLGPLHAAPASMHEPDEHQALVAAGPQVLLDHRGHVAGSERVEVQYFRYRERERLGLVGHQRPGGRAAAAAKYAGRYSESP